MLPARAHCTLSRAQQAAIEISREPFCEPFHHLHVGFLDINLRFSLHNIGDETWRSSQPLCANTTTPNFVTLVGYACRIQPYATPYRGLMGIRVGRTII